MKRNEAIELIRLRIGQDLVPGWDERIRLELEMAQSSLELEAALPWFLLTINDTLDAAAGIATVALPAGFLRLGNQGGLFRYDATRDDPWVALQRDSYETLCNCNLGDGTPQWFAILGGMIHLFPTPILTTDLRLIFYQSGGSLATNTATNPWLVNAPEVLIHETCARVDHKRTGMWMELAQNEKNRIRLNEDQRNLDGLVIRIVPE